MKVLVIEDDPVVRGLLERGLRDGDDHARERATAAGADAFVDKAAGVPALLAAIDERLAGRR
jgi:CheY-like chemotaxis protein